MPSTVLSLLPQVSATTSPVEAGVQLYQADAPPATPAAFGSPGFLVNPLLVPSTVIGSCALSFSALANSFAAAGELVGDDAEATAAHPSSATVTASAQAPAFRIMVPSSPPSCDRAGSADQRRRVGRAGRSSVPRPGRSPHGST